MYFFYVVLSNNVSSTCNVCGSCQIELQIHLFNKKVSKERVKIQKSVSSVKFIFKLLLISRSVDPSLIYVFVLRKLSLKRIGLLLKDHKTFIGSLYDTTAPQYKLTLSPIPVKYVFRWYRDISPAISRKLRFDKFSAQCDEISFGLDWKSLHAR